MAGNVVVVECAVIVDREHQELVRHRDGIIIIQFVIHAISNEIRATHVLFVEKLIAPLHIVKW
jgi:hypothetical protein